ncbi:MAG: hypothetical protein DRP09_13485 [Candidatus Thorarchaeota archaeon]|nr:MAG: hypothetical protein DRP09_13485 [Candidatus Thorarchaeota archaeon]
MTLTEPTHDISLVWDEINDDDFDRYEIWRTAYLPITGVNQGLKQFIIGTFKDSWYNIGDTVAVTGSTGNDGNYTISAVTESAGATIITVQEAIPNATADGFIGNVLISQLAGIVRKGYYKDKEMPIGYYYYVVYAVDDRENYSDPSSIIQKFSPMDITPPATPTGLVAQRSTKYNSVELYWNETEQYDIKGYIIRRTLNPYAGTPTWETIGITKSNSFTDSDIPKGIDTVYKRTDVAYYIESYDTSGNVSSPTLPTGIFELPIITGVRVNLDYLSLNVYWDKIVPEVSSEAVACLLRVKGSSNWVFMGVSEWPKNFFRIGTELLPDTDYELALAIVKSGVHEIIEHNNPGAIGEFKILGDYTTEFPGGDYLAIYESSNLDGQYLINSSSYSAPYTTIQTNGTVPAKYTVNGVNQARNYITISGDHVLEFQDKKVTISIFGSTGNDGRYRVLNVDLYLGQTRLFLMEPLPNTTPDGNVTSGTLINLTDLLETIQTPTQVVPIPDYDTDTTDPIGPALLKTDQDPENNRIFLNWSRIAVEDDFLEFHVEVNVLGGDFPITVADMANDYFQVAGDQRPYFMIGQRVYVYRSTGNDGWYDVTNVTYTGANTRIWIDGNIPDPTADGKLETDYAWILLDKTKRTEFEAYFQYSSGTTYWLRVRAVDRSGNKSLPDSCITSTAWSNPFSNPSSLLLPQWLDYTESYYTTYKNTNMRRYNLTINAGGQDTPWFKRFVLYFILRTQTTVPWSFFNLTEDEILSKTKGNTFSWDTDQFYLPITGVNTGAGTFTVAGDVTGIFTNGVTFTVYNDGNSPSNNGNYTVVSSSYAGGSTTITVYETIPSGTVAGGIGWSIYVWPAVEDVNGIIWPGPTSSIREINPTI